MEEKSYCKVLSSFYKKFVSKIAPFVRQYEKDRKRYCAMAIFLTVIFPVISIFGFIFTFKLGEIADANVNLSGICIYLSYLLFCASVILFLATFVVYHFAKKSFENDIKKKIMPTVCSCYGNLQWSSDTERTDRRAFEYINSHLIPNYNYKYTAEYDDIFRGVHRGVGFEIIEADFWVSGKVILDEIRDLKVFKGIIVALRMNKRFNSHTIIRQKTFFPRLLFENLRLKKTTLEDVKFNNRFDVFCNDEIEARYLITPAFMERLKNLKLAFSAKKIDCTFYNSSLLIALHTNKDLFSICSLIKPLDDIEQYKIMNNELVSILKIIDYFKLNEKTGL